MTEKPLNALALEARKKNKSKDAEFNRLSENRKWRWLEYSCSHTPKESLRYISILLQEQVNISAGQ